MKISKKKTIQKIGNACKKISRFLGKIDEKINNLPNMENEKSSFNGEIEDSQDVDYLFFVCPSCSSALSLNLEEFTFNNGSEVIFIQNPDSTYDLNIVCPKCDCLIGADLRECTNPSIYEKIHVIPIVH